MGRKEVSFDTETKVDIPGCAGRTAGGPCWRSHLGQRGQLTSHGVRGGHLKVLQWEEILLDVLAGGLIGTQRLADIPG